MANRWKDSVDNDNLASFSTRWLVTGSTITVETSGGRQDRACVRQRDGDRASITLPADDEYHIGSAFIYESVPATTRWFARVADGDFVHLRLGINTSGQLVIGNNAFTVLWTGSTALIPESEYYIEWSSLIHASTGTSAVYLNGSSSPDATAYSGNTKNASGAAVINGFHWRGEGSSIYWRWHDFYVNDSTGASPDNTRWGDTKVFDRVPTEAGTYATLTPEPAVANHLNVDDTPGNDGDTTYNHGITGVDTYGFGAWGFTALNVRGADLELMARRVDATSRTLACRAVVAATDFDSSTQSPGTSYLPYRFPYPLNPDTSAAWDQADLEAAEFGPKVA